jgi:hypothetical protein
VIASIRDAFKQGDPFENFFIGRLLSAMEFGKNINVHFTPLALVTHSDPATVRGCGKLVTPDQETPLTR